MAALFMSRHLDSPDANNPRPATDPSRLSLQKALLAALAQGPAGVTGQIQAILALSRAVPPDSTAEPSTQEAPISVEHARLLALAQTADALPESRVKRLIRQALRVEDPFVRLQMIVPLALHLPPQHYQTIMRDIWMQSRGLENPIARAQILFELAPLLTLAQDEPATPSVLMDVLALAQSINNHEARVRSLVALAPHLPGTVQLRVLNRVLDEIDSLRGDTLSFNVITAMAENLPLELLDRALRSALQIRAPQDRARALTALARYLPGDQLVSLRAETLTAIGSIEHEDARAEALIAFAPHLEFAAHNRDFPALLEKALAFAVGMSRRQHRASTLVALTPHLPQDLQGEALAAVHGISDERERAALLALLVPHLPPDILVASLAVAHGMQEGDARAQALTILAHHLPPASRAQTIHDALTAATNLSHHFERVTALLGLVDILPPPLLEQALTLALDTVSLIKNENTRARALNLIAPHLPPSLLPRALETAQHLGNLQLRINTLTSMIPHLPEDRRQALIAALLADIRELRVEYKRARALIAIAPLMLSELLPTALDMAGAIDEPYDRVSALIALAQNAPPELRPTIVASVWTQIKGVEDGYDHASALAAIAPLLPEAAREDLARRAGMVIGAIMDEYDQASAIGILAPLFSAGRERAAAPLPSSLAALKEGLQIALRIPGQAARMRVFAQGVALWADLPDAEQSFALWKDLAVDLAALPLADVLLSLRLLMKIIHSFAGDAALQEIARILGMR